MPTRALESRRGTEAAAAAGPAAGAAGAAMGAVFCDTVAAGTVAFCNGAVVAAGAAGAAATAARVGAGFDAGTLRRYVD